MAVRVDRRVLRTRRRLREALLALIVEQEYESITIEAITERADVNRSTFYLHYATKEELLVAALETQFDALVAQFDGISLANPVWEESRNDRLVFEHVAAHAPLYKVLLGERGMGYIVHRIITYIAGVSMRQLEQSLPPGAEPAIPAPVIAHHIAGSLFALLSWWVLEDMPYSPAEMAEMWNRMGVEGCGPALGLAQ